jgi:hypothetical protein
VGHDRIGAKPCIGSDEPHAMAVHQRCHGLIKKRREAEVRRYKRKAG